MCVRVKATVNLKSTHSQLQKNGVGRLYCMDKHDKLVNCLKNK